MSAEVRAAVADVPLWYHTIEVAPGVETPGWFDLRPVVDRMPWPDVRGKRCLDVGTYDGFLAFELERRGAAEVVATDIEGHDDWDWLPRAEREAEILGQFAGEKGRGFAVAAAARRSAARREVVSVYDLDPRAIGTFDVVVCGSLLLHLRDPFRALAAIRGVCDGLFLSAETVDVGLTLAQPRQPATRLVGEIGQWHVPNAAGHTHMLHMAGFDVLEASRPYSIPFGAAHPARPASLRARAEERVQQLVTGGAGVPTRAALCRPAR